MDYSIGSTIEKIRLQEQDNETKLKEKREFEGELASHNKTVRDTLSQIEKYQQENTELVKETDKLKAQLEMQKIRCRALTGQIQICNEELHLLRSQSDHGMSKVWELRASLSEAVQEVSDKCDIWALLMKPVGSKPLPRVQAPGVDRDQILGDNERRLREAVERRDRALAERDRLEAEPDIGNDFLRIKNALRYSMELIKKQRKE